MDGGRGIWGGRLRGRFAALVVAGSLLGTVGGVAADEAFRRGDSNGDGQLDISDPVDILIWLFLGGSGPTCVDAADANDSGAADMSDAIYALNFLFTGGPELPEPGHLECGTDPTPDALACVSYLGGCDGSPPPVTDLVKIGHVLNRLGYGPTQESVDYVQAIGIEAYIDEQLHPERIDESGNTALNARVDALFDTIVPSKDRKIVAAGALWRYLKGSAAPPATWRDLAFDDSGWLSGPSGFGYGDGDDATVIGDMKDFYVSVFLRRKFAVTDPTAIQSLILRVDYDDGFVAYLNGVEVARSGISGSPPAHTATATSHEAGTAEDFDLTARKGLLVAGDNVLAIQVHNQRIDSGDLSMIPELIDREILPIPPRKVIRGVAELQELLHIRGIYSRRQLQAVLGEFWENHFTTDVEKVAEYFDELQNSDASDAMSAREALREAAQVEYEEQQFFYENALGNFGDLLLFSATSPSMLVYLDSVLNVKGNANENYPREIFELSALGVDNRYTQADIEQLSKCFTGWQLCKVTPENVQPFPQRALLPPTACGVQYEDIPLVSIGPGWRYRKGTAEPAPGPGDAPTADWALPGFDDAAWSAGSTGIGYGDQDDATVLSDMRGSYASVYLRRTFNVADPEALENLVLEVGYDDGFVAYINGIEVARSYSMRDTGTPPARDRVARDAHEVSEGPDLFNLNRYRELLQVGANVLAIQVHNASLDSGDLSMLPRLVDRLILPGSVENGDPQGVWTFQFVPALHDTSAKTIFAGTAYEIKVPAGRVGQAGLSDAIDVVTRLVDHPSTAEFISIKLIQKLVSDELTLATYRSRTAPPELLELLAEAIAAWNSTSPRGNVARVLETILDPRNQGGHFWSPTTYASKVKTPVEFINSTVRLLDATISGTFLQSSNERMGMAFFTRDEPDGWPEIGVRWIDTASMLSRITFAQRAAQNSDTQIRWSPTTYLSARGISTAEEVVDYFDGLMFQGTLGDAERSLLLEFLETDDAYAPLPLNPADSRYATRVTEFVSMLLCLPRWHFQ